MTELHLFAEIFKREQFAVNIQATGYGFDMTVEDLHERPTRFVFGKNGKFKFFTITP